MQKYDYTNKRTLMPIKQMGDGRGITCITVFDALSATQWKSNTVTLTLDRKDTLNSKRTWSVGQWCSGVATALAWCCEHVANVLNTPYQMSIHPSGHTAEGQVVDR